MEATSSHVEKKLLHSSHPVPRGLPNVMPPLLHCSLRFRSRCCVLLPYLGPGAPQSCTLCIWPVVVLCLSAAEGAALMSREGWT